MIKSHLLYQLSYRTNFPSDRTDMVRHWGRKCSMTQDLFVRLVEKCLCYIGTRDTRTPATGRSNDKGPGLCRGLW
jgi:hypothetical protein